jgi:type IV pilus assembly protein PilM
LGGRVVGIDFGYGVIRGVEVEDAGTRRQRVLRSATLPIDDDIVVSGEVRDTGAVASALRQLWSKGGFRSRKVVIGMGNSRVLARDLQVPVRPVGQIRESLQYLVADLLPMPLENAVLDYYPISSTLDASGVAVYDGMLVAALKDVVLQNAKAIRLAGLELVGVDLLPFALVRALADRESADTIAFVDVGATTTIITVATAGVPEFVRIIPVGGEDVTRSLMELGQLTRDQAEQIKRTVGLSADGVEPRYRPVVELMVARSSELMTSIRDTVQYFADTRQRRVAAVVLSGGGARLGRFAETVTAWTRIPSALATAADDAAYLMATALASGVRVAGEPRVGATRNSASAGIAAPTTETTVVPGFAGTDTPTPAPGWARSEPADAASATAPAQRRSKPAPAPKAPKVKKEKKDSIWNRPLGGGRKS